MPYVVLARRRRPRLFKDVVGQEHVTRTLQNAIATNRIAHAYLFTGPRGVGKTTVARILAKAVNCKNGPQPEPCEECDACKEISAGRSIDVIEIDAASNRGIDEIRELRESVKFAPVSGRYKVYIIDEAHMLTIEAFNALLKTLEEPPEHVIFILATTEPHKFPETILSRCQRFDFRLLNLQEIVDRLRYLTDADNIPAEDEALTMIAESADGSLRDAESALDQLLSFSNGKLEVAEVSKLLGLGAYQLLDQLVDKILQKDSAGSLEALSVLADHGADLSQCLRRLVSYFRDLMFHKINPDLIEVSETKRQQLIKHSSGVSINRLMKSVRMFMQAESDIKQLGYERLNLELALVRLSKLEEDDIPLDQILGRLEDIQSKFASGAVAVAAQPNQVNSVAAASVVEEEEETTIEYDESDPKYALWSKLLDAIKDKHSIALYAVLREAKVLSIDNDILVIDIDPKLNWHREQVGEIENREIIQTELLEISGKQMRFKLNSPDSDEENEADIPKSQIDMQRDARKDETVRLVLDTFDGRVVEVKE